MEEGNRLDEDDFWCVALDHFHKRDCLETTATETSVTTFQQQHNSRSYTLALSENETVTLTLGNLAENDGVWSPLGAQAWHASALLAAYLLAQSTTPQENNERGSEARPLFQDKQDVPVLELGSGAVGLSSLALAITVGRAQNKSKNSHVLLTDLNIDGMLDNLQRNFLENQDAIQHACGGNLPNISVHELDWNSYLASSKDDDGGRQPPNPPLPCGDLQLIVGSELIYTKETAVACAAVILTLLRQFPQCQALIVQVTDRYGFYSHFLPLLTTEAELSVRIEQPLNQELFDNACNIVASSNSDNNGSATLGGTLDRFDYGACWVRTKSANDRGNTGAD